MKKNNILFIINGLGFGGAETQLIRLSKALMDQGYNISIITLTNDLALLDRLDKNIKHINIPLQKNIKLFKQLKFILKTVKDIQPDVIHAHLFQANIISRFIKFFNKKIKVINTTHGAYLLKNRSYNPYFIYRLTKNWVNFHTAVSKEVLNLLRKQKAISINKSRYVPNGLFVDQYKLKKQNTGTGFKWLSIGRLHPVKAYDRLIHVAKLLKQEEYPFTLHIAGDGKERKKLELLILQLDLTNEVQLLGIQTDISTLFSYYDSFVISSYSEGLPMVLLEAMSASLPIVSTDVGEIGNILSQSKGGILIPPDNIKSLKNAMSTIMNHPKEKLIEFGHKNYIFAKKNYDINSLVNNWLEIYFDK